MGNAQPRWFGPSDRPLLGWVHTPSEGRARGAVVICASMGQEAAFAQYSLRTVAHRLADRGLVVVRFDYDGTGDSVGNAEDPDRMPAWLRSIGYAIDLARSLTPAPLSLLGIRLGALLAVRAAEGREDVDSLVLWDCPRSGSSYIREQRVRQNTSVGGADPELAGFSALGMAFDDATVEQLGALNLRSLHTLPADTVLSIDKPSLHALSQDAVTRTGAPAQRIEAPDMDDFWAYQTLPSATETAVVSWYDETCGDAAYDVRDAGSTSPTIRVPGGTETFVRIGEQQLFGIHSVPDEPRTTTSAVFVPNGHTPHVGLARIWTETSRQWVAEGIPSLRFDVSGCGDSDPRPGFPGHQMHLVEHLDEVDDAARFANPTDPTDTILIGSCSGAYHSTESALSLGVRGIAVVNPVNSFPTQEQPVSPRRGAMVLTRRAIHRPLGKVAGKVAWLMFPGYHHDPAFQWDRMLESCFWQRAANHQLPWLPEWVWTILNWLLVEQRPVQLVRRIRARGTSVLFIAGGHDWTLFTLGSMKAMRRMQRRGGLEMVDIPDLDHALMRPGKKQQVAAHLTSFVEGRMAGAGVRRTTGSAA